MERGKKSYYSLVFFIFLSILFLFCDLRGLFFSVKSLVSRGTVPIQLGLYGFKSRIVIPIDKFWVRDQDSQLSVLLDEKQALIARVGSLKSVEEENTNLRRLLGSGVASNWLFEILQVVGQGGDSLFAINKSGTDFVKPGMVVISNNRVEAQKGGVYVGRVKHNNLLRIEVMLPSDPASKVPVYLRDRVDYSRRVASGLVVGRGGRFIIDQVLREENLNSGDLIYTLGDEFTPPDLLIGAVGRVLSVREGAWQQAEIVEDDSYKKMINLFVVYKF